MKKRSLKGKDKQKKLVLVGVHKGQARDNSFSLGFNSATDRVDLREDGRLLYSGPFHHCMFKADTVGIIWDDKRPELILQ